MTLKRGSSEQGVSKTYISQGDVLDKIRVNAGPLVHLLQQGIDDVLQARVFEAAFPGLCERCPDGEGDDNIVGILGCPIFRATCISRYPPIWTKTSSMRIGMYLQRSQRAPRGEVLEDGSQSFHGHLVNFESTSISKKN